MSLHLVSEARPIPWKRLSELERTELRRADGWIEKVINDARRAKPTADEIDRYKSGRVLFIDGPRGAGKTSLLLTLLERWRGKEPYAETKQSFDDRSVLLPILDFDPLPRGMPLHGWLLEPWRKAARSLDKDARAGAEGKELTEMWADVFERAVLGWSPVTVEGKGVVEKALAYQEQASGWVDTRKHWHELVNAAVCRSNRCSSKECRGAHPFVFVVAIDDVDLQVEQVPNLLHAIRLLHHPNVVYVLTGNMDHLRFVLELDYIRQHEGLLLDVGSSAARGRSERRSLSEKIRSFSSTLRDALLDKALPSHSRVELTELSLKVMLEMHVDGEDETSKVSTRLGARWLHIATQMKDLRVVTARRAQHAIDKHLHGAHKEDESVGKAFIADVCGAAFGGGRILLQGQLTTILGTAIRRWEGDRLSIQLMEQPRFAFEPHSDESEYGLSDEYANGVAAIQLAAEEGMVVAPDLFWAPEAGIATTEVNWESGVLGFTEDALFHWPWLLRPTVSEVLAFGKVADAMKSKAGDSVDRINLADGFIVEWLRQNIKWQYNREAKDFPLLLMMGSWDRIAEELKNLCTSDSPLSRLKRYEVIRWVFELVVMTAPYFGLPDEVASRLRKMCVDGVLAKLVPKPSREYIRNEVGATERRAVEDAIIVGKIEAARRRGQVFDGKGGPNSPEYSLAAKDFLAKREKMSPTHEWWKWKKSKAAAPNPRTAKSRSKKNTRKVGVPAKG